MALVQADLPETSTDGDLESQQNSPKQDKQDGHQQGVKALVQVDLPDTSTDVDLESQQRSPKLNVQDGHQRSPMPAGREHQDGLEVEEEEENRGPEAPARHTSGPAKAERAVALRWYHIVLLVSLTVLAPFSTDAYIPSMGTMMTDFNTSKLLVSLSLPINMMVSGVSTVPLGHLSDRIGRRPVLLACVAVHILGSCLCAVAPSVESLLVARAIQGLGAGLGPLPTAVVQDVTEDRDEFMRIGSIFGALRPAANVLAPVIGAHVAWRPMFWSTAAWGCLNLVLVFALLPETLALQRPDGRGGSQREVPGSAVEAGSEAENGQHTVAASTTESQHETSSAVVPGWKSKLRRLCCDRLVTGSLLSFTVLFSAIILMLMNISLVLEGDYHWSTEMSGFLISSVSCSMFVPPILVGLLSLKSVSPLAFLRAGMGFGILVAAAACAVTPFAGDHFWLFMAIMYGLVVTESTVAPAMNTLFLLTLQDMSGLACSVQDGLRNFVSAGIAIAVAVTDSMDGPDIPIKGLLVGIAVLLASSSAIFWASFGLWPPEVVRQVTKPPAAPAN